MKALILYARDEDEAERFRRTLRDIKDAPIVQVAKGEEQDLRLPAIRSETYLYEGEREVALILARLLQLE